MFQVSMGIQPADGLPGRNAGGAMRGWRPSGQRICSDRAGSARRAGAVSPNSAALARLSAVSAAVADEQARFNAALAAGARAHLTVATYPAPLLVSRVDAAFWYYTPASNGGFGSSWAGCNDGTWADLLRQAGVARNPMFGEVK